MNEELEKLIFEIQHCYPFEVIELARRIVALADILKEVEDGSRTGISKTF